MNVKQIVEQHLKANGFDGLCNDEDCGCKLGDLFPCEGANGCCPCECVPGYKKKVEVTDSDFFGHDWIITEEKPDESQDAL